jgi:hypothetical protein
LTTAIRKSHVAFMSRRMISSRRDFAFSRLPMLALSRVPAVTAPTAEPLPPGRQSLADAIAAVQAAQAAFAEAEAPLQGTAHGSGPTRPVALRVRAGAVELS